MQELVGKDSCLWDSPDSTLYYEVNESVIYVFVQIVLLNNPLWKRSNWHLRIFILIQGGCQANFFNIQAHILNTWGAKYAIPHQF